MKKKTLCIILVVLVAIGLCVFAICKSCSGGGKTNELKSDTGVTLTGGNFGRNAKLIAEKVEMTEEEVLEHLNEPEVEEREDGTVTVYYLDQKLDVTDKFDEDGVCYVQLEGGEKTIYMTIKRGNGYATSTTKYILPSEFNN